MTKNKKIKAKKLSKVEAIGNRQVPCDVPREVDILLKNYYSKGRRKEYPLHFAGDTIGITKSWMAASSRCIRNRQRQLCSLDAPTKLVESCAVGSCPYSKGQTVAFVGRLIRPDGFCHRSWPKYECLVVDPFDAKKRYMELVSVVGCQGKLYALSLQGSLAVIEDIEGTGLMVTRISSDRAVPSVPSKFFKECLVQLDGEVFLVLFIHAKSLEIIDQVEVFRLCFVKFEWIKVGRLRGKTLLLNEYGGCRWVNSEELGCRGDCVYFTRPQHCNTWWLYDMETCCISSAP